MFGAVTRRQDKLSDVGEQLIQSSHTFLSGTSDPIDARELCNAHCILCLVHPVVKADAGYPQSRATIDVPKRLELPHPFGKLEVIRGYSVVISRYGFPEDAIGTIGIIGPTRMPYGRAISTIKHLATVLTELIAELYGRQRTD